MSSNTPNFSIQQTPWQSGGDWTGGFTFAADASPPSNSVSAQARSSGPHRGSTSGSKLGRSSHRTHVSASASPPFTGQPPLFTLQPQPAWGTPASSDSYAGAAVTWLAGDTAWPVDSIPNAATSPAPPPAQGHAGPLDELVALLLLDDEDCPDPNSFTFARMSGTPSAQQQPQPMQLSTTPPPLEPGGADSGPGLPPARDDEAGVASVNSCDDGFLETLAALALDQAMGSPSPAASKPPADAAAGAVTADWADDALLPAMQSLTMEDAPGAASASQQHGTPPGRTRVRVRKTHAPGQHPPGAAAEAIAAALRGPAASPWAVPLRAVLAAPSPHDPEALAALLLAGRIVRPVGAPAVSIELPWMGDVPGADEDEASCAAGGATPGVHAATPAPQGPSQQSSPAGLEGQAEGHTQGQGQPLAGGPMPGCTAATATVVCSNDQELAMALRLQGRHVYCPPVGGEATGGRGAIGGASWRPITVLAPHAGGDNYGASAPAAPKLREPAPSVRAVMMWGVPSHINAGHLASLFGSATQLPGHSNTPPAERRFLLLAPDAVSYSALLGWDRTLLPDKVVDALGQVVPGSRGWCEMRVEEEDGSQLPPIVNQLLAAAAGGSCACCPAPTPTAASCRAHTALLQQLQQQRQPPRISGLFHPADLDAMDGMGPSGAADISSGVAGSGGGSTAGVPAWAHHARPLQQQQHALLDDDTGLPARHDQGADQEMDEISLAERAASSSGASSSGAPAGPTPRAGPGSRRGGSGLAPPATALQPQAGTGAACACCPPGPSSGSPAASGRACSWSGPAAIDALNRLLGLGVCSPDEASAEPQVEPYFRRSRKRMPTHFGRLPEEMEAGEEDDATAALGSGGGSAGPKGSAVETGGGSSIGAVAEEDA